MYWHVAIVGDLRAVGVEGRADIFSGKLRGYVMTGYLHIERR